MHDATEEAELFGNVTSILTDVFLRSPGVPADPLIKVCRARENVGRMSLLRNFDHRSALQLLSREFGICARFFCEVAVDVADDGRVWGFGDRRREGVARLELAAKPLHRTATPNVVGCNGYQ